MEECDEWAEDLIVVWGEEAGVWVVVFEVVALVVALVDVFTEE